jgi:3'-5' exonuclease
MSKGFVVFDIETRPQPIEQLKKILPGFDASSIKDPGEFDPKSVKVGNLKDQAKIDEKIEAARAEHEAAKIDLVMRRVSAELNHWQEAFNKAALSATTGEVVAIGIQSENGSYLQLVTDTKTEADILRKFWTVYQSLRIEGRKICGFNSREFDIPFIAQRSAILGVDIPSTLIQNERYLDSIFVDLRDRWGFGSRPNGSLDLICRACGIGGKPDGVDGSMFWQLYDDAKTRDQAIAYLENDLKLTWELAKKLIP